MFVFIAAEWWSFCHVFHPAVTNATNLPICAASTAFVLFCSPLASLNTFAQPIP